MNNNNFPLLTFKSFDIYVSQSPINLLIRHLFVGRF